MRIELQGILQSLPTYSHVGYTSAFIDPEIITRKLGPSPVPSPHLLFLCAVAFFAFTLWAGARAQGVAVLLWRLLGVTVASCCVVIAVTTPRPVRWVPTDKYLGTAVRLEKVCATTEAWAAQHGRVPTRAEWEALIPLPERTDTWGKALVYRTVPFRNVDDGQGYEIIAPLGRTLEELGLRSPALGADGLLGTPDDERERGDGGSFEFRHVDLKAIPHGRAPRQWTTKVVPPPELVTTVYRLEKFRAVVRDYHKQHQEWPGRFEIGTLLSPAELTDGWGNELEINKVGSESPTLRVKQPKHGGFGLGDEWCIYFNSDTIQSLDKPVSKWLDLSKLKHYPAAQ